MRELVWINGEVMPLADARVSVEERGFQFADGIYEVMRVYDGQPFALDEHLGRLARSAQGIRLVVPLSNAALARQIIGLVERCGMRQGMVYVQLTRGAGPRSHVVGAMRPNLLFYCRELPPTGEVGQGPGVMLWPVADERWKRCWIKSIALLPNVLAKNEAVAAGYDEAVFVEDGVVSECSSSNIFAVIGGALYTHPAGAKVLPGITRQMILELAGELEVVAHECAVSQREMLGADELFITSTTREISWVSRWGEQVLHEQCGPITARLHHALKQRIRSSEPMTQIDAPDDTVIIGSCCCDKSRLNSGQSEAGNA